MTASHREIGRLGIALQRYRGMLITVVGLSAVLNVLLLGGSIYMMMVYDSVLPSHSLPTLFSLLAMVVLVYAFQGMFDLMRSRLLGDIGAALDRELAPTIQAKMGDAALLGARTVGDGLMPMRDLDQIRQFLSSSGPAALIDLPWILFFLVVLSLLHIWLGVTAFVGALVMIGLTLLTDRGTAAPAKQLAQVAAVRSGMAEANLRHVEVLSALGMRGRMRDRWFEVNDRYLGAQHQLSQSVGTLGGVSKIFRMLLQSLILTVGALLVIQGKASGGVIFASSILSGRALAPIDTAIANWRGFAAARAGWRRLNELLARLPGDTDLPIALPAPTKELAVQQLVVGPPGTQLVKVQGVNFTLKAGEALGVIGPSAAGKTSLARALVGVWLPLRGSIRLDGASLDQWDRDRLGGMIGYLPQSVELLDGSVAQNIARFEPEPDAEAVIAAARAAGVHELVVNLPNGYDTPVGSDGSQLSAGQRQRIGLARALYRDPFFVLLDEPNSNLDAPGEQALQEAIRSVRERKGIVVVIAHRPAVLTLVSHVMIMRDGRMDSFGVRDEILNQLHGGTNIVPAAPAPTRSGPVAVAGGKA